MFVPLRNTPRDYAWGADGAISALLGLPPTGRPEAELWLGAHPGSPAVIVDPSDAGGAETLADWISEAPEQALGRHPRLPYLLKVLAAASPLSLQAHPSADQAREGFARENAQGVPLDAAHRNYSDPYPKPEIIYALSDRFEALCGFRAVDDTVALLGSLGLHAFARRVASQGLRNVVQWLIAREPGDHEKHGDHEPDDHEHSIHELGELVEQITALASRGSEKLPKGDTDALPPALRSERELVLDTLRVLASSYPRDPGIAVALLLNRVTLRRDEALFLPAGNIHAYLRGVGVELMTASDNVLRGGLTPKHIDGDELLSVLDFTPTPVPYLEPEVAGGASVYRPDGVGFALTHITGAAQRALSGPAIALCTAGSSTVTGASGSVRLSRGEAVFITPDEASLQVTGDGEIFLATTE